jgi:hypothetical protein
LLVEYGDVGMELELGISGSNQLIEGAGNLGDEQLKFGLDSGAVVVNSKGDVPLSVA